jgi:type IV secretion system protein TrbB
MTLDRTASPRQDTFGPTICRHLGPAVLQLVADPDVTEIYRNPADPRLWVDTRSRGRVATAAELGAAETRAFLNAVASFTAQSLTPATPSLEAKLPEELFRGARLQGFIPPVVEGPCFNLRKPPAEIYDLGHWQRQGVLSAAQCDLLAEHVRARSNVLVAGGTRTGKTTFVNSLLRLVADLCPEDRLVILEDTPELQCAARDRLLLRTTDGVPLAALVRATLRASPDRIVVGEVRDACALDLLDAWSTGHPGGFATVHATDAATALDRLDRLAMRAGVASQRHLVAAAVQLVLVLVGSSDRRRVHQLVTVDGLDAQGRYLLRPALPDPGA